MSELYRMKKYTKANRRLAGAAAPISDEWRNCIWRFGVMGGKEFTLSNPLFTLSALDYFPFFTI